MKLGAYLLMICLFSVGAVFSAEYFRSASVQEPAALSASAIEAMRAASAFANISLIAQSAFVANIDTGAVLYEQNADAQMPLASLTKVPLALAASEVLPADSIITVTNDTGYNSRASQLLAGERWRAKDIVAYTLVSSSNDGALLLADVSDETIRAKFPHAPEKATVWRMNDIARALHLKSMYFLNPTGLDESATLSGSYGSARDVARLFAYAQIRSPELFTETATSSIWISSESGRVAQAVNTDVALESFSGILMGKTGLTDLAGGNLAVVFEAGDHRYAAVVLGSTEEGRFSDMKKMVAAVHAMRDE
jgi:D-alanyl-D-alanine carboxypeptidase